jgi:hypothetical protein
MECQKKKESYTSGSVLMQHASPVKLQNGFRKKAISRPVIIFQEVSNAWAVFIRPKVIEKTLRHEYM